MNKDFEARRKILADIQKKSTPLFMEGFSVSPGTDTHRKQLLGTQSKSSVKDLVTRFDRMMEDFLREELNRAFPGETVIGEEEMSASKAASSREVCARHDAFWILDPIDGTTNYSRSFPFFCTTGAFVTRQSPQNFSVEACSTWDPCRSELFSASRGGGAWVNGQAMKVAQPQALEEVLTTIGFAIARQDGEFTELLKSTEGVLKHCLGFRRTGSAALDLAYVASGRTDTFWEKGLEPWDTAAGSLMIREAGGLVTRFDLGEWDPLFNGAEILGCANTFLQKWLKDLLKSV